MMVRRRSGIACGVGVLAFAFATVGCGDAPRDDPAADAFAAVRKDVSARGDLRVPWRRDAAADHQADAAVADILARPLSADGAVQVALLRDPGIQERCEELGISQADLVAAGLLKNPVFAGQVDLFASGPAVEISFVADVVSVFTRGARKRLAAARADAVAAEVTAAIIAKAAAVRAAVVAVQAAQQDLAIVQQTLEAANAADDLSARIRAAGNSTALDRLRREAMTAQTRLDCASAEDAVVSARAQLTMALGVWGHEAEWSISDDLAAVPPESATKPAHAGEAELPAPDAERLAVANSLRLTAQRARIQAAAEQLGLQRTWLDIALGVDVQRDLDSHEWGVGPKVEVAVPIADNGDAGRAAAAGALAAAIDDYRAMSIRLRADARLAADRVAETRRRAAYIAAVVIPLRHHITAEVMLQVNGMLDSAFGLLDATVDGFAAERDEVQALRAYWLARARLRMLLEGADDDAGREP
jgi:cobalt-zinc-cadmium efflux system outer membrane protein